MEAYDNSMTKIKVKESNDDVISIFQTLKIANDKNIEMYSKLYELQNKIDDLENKIEVERKDVIQIMEKSSFVKRKNEADEKYEIIEKKAKMNIDRL